VQAFYVGEEGMDIVSVVKPNRITVPTFEIAELAMIPITQIKERRFDVVQRTLNLGKAEMGSAEDEKIFGLLDATAAAAANALQDDYVLNPDLGITAPITVSAMADGFAQVERHDLPVAYNFFNPRDYADLRKWTQENIDRETQRKLIKTGVMGYLWGATLLVSRKVNYGIVYILTEDEFLGVIPERVPLTVMSADRPDLRQIGFSIFEILGFTVFNPSGVQRLVIARAVTVSPGTTAASTTNEGNAVPYPTANTD
jgi:hypothetical protein